MNAHRTLLFLLLATCLFLPGDAEARQFEDGTVTLDGKTFSVAVANDNASRSRGLMFVQHLGNDQGMLFVFPDTQQRSFWMKNTIVDLDIIYFDENRRLLNVQTAYPCRSTPCLTYPSRGRARYVLEINAGLSQRYGFERGMTLEIDVDQALLEQGYRH